MNYFKLWNEVNLLVLNQGTLFERNAMLEIKKVLDREVPKPRIELPSRMVTVGMCSICDEMIKYQEHKNYCGNCGNKIDWKIVSEKVTE